MQLGYVVTLFAGLVAALPTPEAEADTGICSKKLESHKANFDHQKAPFGVNAPRLSAPLLGLTYDGFLIESTALELAGLSAHSAPNTAFYNGLSSILDTLQAHTIAPTLANRAVGFKSVYLGCATDVGILRAPCACTVTATGVDAVTDMAVSHVFDVPASSSMSMYQFPPSFSKLKKLAFTTGQISGLPIVSSTSFDNLVYDIYKC